MGAPRGPDGTDLAAMRAGLNGTAAGDVRRTIVHLMASPFFGGPEHYVLGLMAEMAPAHRSVVVSFAEGGRCRPLLERARAEDLDARELRHNAPHFRAAVREIRDVLAELGAAVLCCHGYKADLLGWPAARRAGIPVVAVSHGWTAATLKVRLNELLDRASLHAMDRVVCVSGRQAAKVRRAGVPAERIDVIHNSIRPERFACRDESYREVLRSFFRRPPRWIVGGAGRFSPEKGFQILAESAARVVARNPEIGFVVFGDGPLRDSLERYVRAHRLEDRFILPGFRTDLDRFLPHFDVFALSSYTEGLPTVVLEAFAAGVPVVATDVGGTAEVVEDGVNGMLVPSGRPAALARAVLAVLEDEGRRRAMAERGRRRVEGRFNFKVQAAEFERVLEKLWRRRSRRAGRVLPAGPTSFSG